MKMLMSKGGGGRDVMFKLTVAADPADKQVLRRWGEDVSNQQKTIHTATVNAQKKAETDFAKWKSDLVRNSAVLEQKETMKRLQAEKRAEQDFIQWRDNLRKN